MTGSGVAVVIPAFRCAPVVADAVQSALRQTLPPDEVVVVDDGSPDDVAAAVRGLPVRYLRRDNGGPGAARNTGIAATTAPLVAFLDADDLWEPGKLAAQVALLARHPEATAACADAWIESADGRRARWSERHDLTPRITLEQLLRGNVIPTLTVVVRRSALAQAGGFDEDRGLIAVEDYDLWLKLLEHGPIVAVSEPLAVYRRGGEQLSGARRFLAGVELVFDKFLARHADRADWCRLLTRRRGALRRDVAWQCLTERRFADARALALESLRFDPLSAAAWKLLTRAALHAAPAPVS